MPRINLTRFGLSQKEEKVYLALIKLGPSPASLIARKTGFKRPSVINYLTSLANRGLVSETFSGRNKLFTPSPPSAFNKILDQQEKEVQKNKELISDLIKKIKRLRTKTPAETKTRILKGKLGFKLFLKDVLKSRRDPYFLVSCSAVADRAKIITIPWFLRNFTAKRRQIDKTRARIIIDPHRLTNRQNREGDYEFRKIKFWKELEEVDSGFVIYGEKIAFFSTQPETQVFIISDRNLVVLFRLIFEKIWDNL